MDKARDIGDCILLAICPNQRPIDRVYAMGTFLCIENDVIVTQSINSSSGVYMLYDESDVLYVGQSEDVKSRVASHKAIKFTGALVAYTETVNLLAIEAMAIGILRPTPNHRNSTRYEPISIESTQCQE